MTPEQFAELFKQAVQQGHIKVELSKDSYYKEISLEIKDKQGETITSSSVYL